MSQIKEAYERGFEDGLRIGQVKTGWYNTLREIGLDQELKEIIARMPLEKKSFWLNEMKKDGSSYNIS